MVALGSRKYKHKQKQQKEKEIKLSLERIDTYSFVSSFLFHVVVLITMSLMYSETSKERPVISITFCDSSETAIEESFVVELPQPDIPEESVANNDSIIIETETTTVDTDSLSMLNELMDSAINSSNPEPHSFSDLTSAEVKLPDRSEIPNEIEQPTGEELESEKVLSNLIASVAAGVASNNRGQETARASSGTDMETRLRNAGAKTGDITISIAWDTIDDIDLHAHYVPGNGLVDNINWTNKIGKLSAGMLDVDMNANYGEIVRFPVENVFWPIGSSPKGSFAIYIHFYRSWSGNNRVPVRVVLKRIGHKDESFNITAILGSSPQRVTSFNNLENKRKF